jgi:molybdopterin-binding protein
VNASSVLVAQVSTTERISARNKIRGVVTSRSGDDAASEISIDIGGAKTITAPAKEQIKQEPQLERKCWQFLKRPLSFSRLTEA